MYCTFFFFFERMSFQNCKVCWCTWPCCKLSVCLQPVFSQLRKWCIMYYFFGLFYLIFILSTYYTFVCEWNVGWFIFNTVVIIDSEGTKFWCTKWQQEMITNFILINMWNTLRLSLTFSTRMIVSKKIGKYLMYIFSYSPICWLDNLFRPIDSDAHCAILVEKKLINTHFVPALKFAILFLTLSNWSKINK